MSGGRPDGCARPLPAERMNSQQQRRKVPPNRRGDFTCTGRQFRRGEPASMPRMLPERMNPPLGQREAPTHGRCRVHDRGFNCEVGGGSVLRRRTSRMSQASCRSGQFLSIIRGAARRRIVARGVVEASNGACGLRVGASRFWSGGFIRSGRAAAKSFATRTGSCRRVQVKSPGCLGGFQPLLRRLQLLSRGAGARFRSMCPPLPPRDAVCPPAK